MQTINNHGYEIVDAHCHIFPAHIAEKATRSIGSFYDLTMHRVGDPETLLHCGGKIGVRAYLVCSTATTAHQVRSINDYIAGVCAAHPEFYGLGSLHPGMDAAAMGEEAAYIRGRGLRGFKLHPDFQSFNIDAPEAYPMYEAAGESPILIHMGDPRYDYSAPYRLAKVLRDFPKLHVIAAHLGGYTRWNEAEAVLPHAAEFLRFDVSSALDFMPPEEGRRLIRLYGAENCFWGADFPMWEPAEELERFLALGLTETENRAILAGNAKEFFYIP